MSDLVLELRDAAAAIQPHELDKYQYLNLLEQAANEIERLRALAGSVSAGDGSFREIADEHALLTRPMKT